MEEEEEELEKERGKERGKDGRGQKGDKPRQRKKMGNRWTKRGERDYKKAMDNDDEVDEEK